MKAWKSHLIEVLEGDPSGECKFLRWKACGVLSTGVFRRS